jgi:hypothetical protein
MQMRTDAIRSGFVSLTALAALASMMLIAGTPPAKAAVYCKYIGVPKGCVTRPGVVLVAAPVVATTAVVRAAAVRAPVGVDAVATPGIGARGVGVRPGTPLNRGGPVNRVGRR